MQIERVGISKAFSKRGDLVAQREEFVQLRRSQTLGERWIVAKRIVVVAEQSPRSRRTSLQRHDQDIPIVRF